MAEPVRARRLTDEEGRRHRQTFMVTALAETRASNNSVPWLSDCAS
jgi:hypothetical protein